MRSLAVNAVIVNAVMVTVGTIALLGACKGPVEIVREVPIFKEVIADPPFPEGWRVADLTMPLDADSPRAAHPRQFPFERMDLPPAAEGGMRTGAFTTMEHTGTHLAAPRTRNTEGATVEAWGSQNGNDLLLPIVVIDAPDGPEPVAMALVLEDVKERGDIPGGAAVLLRSARGARRPASWSDDAARRLTRELHVRLLGTDGPALDPASESLRAPAQAAVAQAGAWQVLGLRGLDALPRRGAWLVVGALPVVGAAGSPARVVALVPPAGRASVVK